VLALCYKQTYEQIFITKEYRVIVGEKNKGNFWILFAVFFLTIGSLSFSSARMELLKSKMDSPFVKWVSIKTSNDSFFSALQDSTKQEKHHFSKVERNGSLYPYVFGASNEYYNISGRSFDYDSDIFTAVLNNSNVIESNKTTLAENDYGWIVTADLMEQLGYADGEYPLFINDAINLDETLMQPLGIEHSGNFQKTPVPIIAVVKQLPNNLDMISTTYFKQQDDFDFALYNEDYKNDYFGTLLFVVEHEEKAKQYLEENLQEFGLEWQEKLDTTFNFNNKKELRAFVQIDSDDNEKISQLNRKLADILTNTKTPIFRYYDYQLRSDNMSDNQYISLFFDDLKDIVAFQEFAKQEFDIDIDMTQIDAKNNYVQFNILALTLSIILSIISILFVLIFIYFLINAHFQKISKNLGTIMAFGLDNTIIEKIYLAVFMKLILVGLISAVVILCLAQCIFSYAQYHYWLNMLEWKVWIVIVAVVLSSITTIRFILQKKLRNTPGNLIYERNLS
jgi:hypothetical protein